MVTAPLAEVAGWQLAHCVSAHSSPSRPSCAGCSPSGAVRPSCRQQLRRRYGERPAGCRPPVRPMDHGRADSRHSLARPFSYYGVTAWLPTLLSTMNSACPLPQPRGQAPHCSRSSRSWAGWACRLRPSIASTTTVAVTLGVLWTDRAGRAPVRFPSCGGCGLRLRGSRAGRRASRSSSSRSSSSPGTRHPPAGCPRTVQGVGYGVARTESTSAGGLCARCSSGSWTPAAAGDPGVGAGVSFQQRCVRNPLSARRGPGRTLKARGQLSPQTWWSLAASRAMGGSVAGPPRPSGVPVA
jgi:hypothetical protein